MTWQARVWDEAWISWDSGPKPGCNVCMPYSQFLQSPVVGWDQLLEPCVQLLVPVYVWGISQCFERQFVSWITTTPPYTHTPPFELWLEAGRALGPSCVKWETATYGLLGHRILFLSVYPFPFNLFPEVRKLLEHYGT